MIAPRAAASLRARCNLICSAIVMVRKEREQARPVIERILCSCGVLEDTPIRKLL
jgi:hypothetical protein